jgi:Domain of unknown function DUF302
MSNPTPTTVDHQMTRIDISTGIGFDDFRRTFEKAAPVFDANALRKLTENGGTWDDVRKAVAASAPHELLVYAMIDGTALLGVAGHSVRAVEYLLGNHVIAETMFRHDPKALLYAPLRVLVHSDADGNAVFSIDRPSGAFGSLGIPAVTEVGLSLDRKVAALLRAIDVDPGDAFTVQL